MRRRRLLLRAGVLALLGLAAGLAVWLAYPRPRVTPENFRRLRLGMTRPQVERILGPPHRAGAVVYSLLWEGDGVRVTLDFSEPGGGGTLDMGDLTFLRTGVRESVRLPASLGGDDEETFLDRLRRLFPW
jgi:hypothetical protein